MPAMLIQWLLLLVTSWAESPGRGKTSRTLTLTETRRGCASSRRMGTELVGRSVLGDIPKGHGRYRACPLRPVEVTLIYLLSGHLREASMQEGCQGESRGLGGYVGSGFQVERPGWKTKSGACQGAAGVGEGIWELGVNLLCGFIMFITFAITFIQNLNMRKDKMNCLLGLPCFLKRKKQREQADKWKNGYSQSNLKGRLPGDLRKRADRDPLHGPSLVVPRRGLIHSQASCEPLSRAPESHAHPHPHPTSLQRPQPHSLRPPAAHTVLQGLA